MSAIGEELGRLLSYQERHRRLLARLALMVIATAVIDLVAAVAMYLLERHTKGTEIKTLGQAAFFTTVQVLTVSSQIKNPLTVPGRVTDIALELWVEDAALPDPVIQTLHEPLGGSVATQSRSH